MAMTAIRTPTIVAYSQLMLGTKPLIVNPQSPQTTYYIVKGE